MISHEDIKLAVDVALARAADPTDVGATLRAILGEGPEAPELLLAAIGAVPHSPEGSAFWVGWYTREAPPPPPEGEPGEPPYCPTCKRLI